MPKYTANPEGKRTAAIAEHTARTHGFDILVHRQPYASCHWLGRSVFYRDGLIVAGMPPDDATVLARALEAETEAKRIEDAAARGYRWAPPVANVNPI
jgi:hypothetical protein